MIDLEVSPGAHADAAAEEQLIDGHLTVPGGLEWDETPVERHTIANLRYAGGKEHDVRYVSEVHLDAALAREAALRESLTDKRDEYNKLGDRYDALQQRLTVAEQLLQETSKAILRHQAEQPMSKRLSGLLTKARASVDRHLNGAALKPAEGEVS